MALSRRLALALVLALTLMPGLSRAEDRYPTRPIRLIVGFAAGSSGDVAARIVSNKLGQILGQPVTVENRPGASSMIATDYVARAAKGRVVDDLGRRAAARKSAGKNDHTHRDGDGAR